MNRNIMYDYLKSQGLKPLIHRRGPKKKHRMYHMEFVVDREEFPNGYINQIILDWGYIRNFDSIHLYQDEIVIESEYGRTKINMRYDCIDKFEVDVFDE